MNARILSSAVLGVICLATFAGVLFQHQQLASLRLERQSFITQQGTPAEASSYMGDATQKVAEPQSPAAPSLELLRLRSEVARLTQRRLELADARSENERLRLQVGPSRTNSSAALPPGYMRKSEARFVGYNSPADTIQSLLWAVQNRNFTNFMQAFAPEAAQQIGNWGEDEFFKGASALPGMHIANQQTAPDGSIEAEVEIIPGQTMPDKMRFRQINGQWKLETR